MIWFKDHTYNDASKKLCLLKAQNHFHGLRSIPALLNRSYYCHHCEKGYDEETPENHNCLGQNCLGCRRTNTACPNFATFVTPDVYCTQCNRMFYGQNCYDAHKRKGAKSVCSQFKKKVLNAAKCTRSIPKTNIAASTLVAAIVNKSFM